jgi:sugar lactone lactonase YvrE
MDFIRNAFFFALTLLLSGLSINRLIAQNNQVGIGEWRSHLSYESIVAITESQDAVYYGSSQAILKVNKEDLSFEYLNKVGGLSDMGISTIEYNLSENLLVVAYNNGNIDLYYKDGLVVNLSSILNNTSVVGDKSVNHILNDGKKIYFSCSFGLVVYDLDIGAFSQTTFTSSEVNACARLNDTLFISTNAGIYSGVLDGRNLLDFGLWELQDASMGLNALDYTSKNIIFFQDKLYADVGDTLIQYVNGQWRHLSGIDYRDTTAYSFWKPSGNNDYINNYNFSLSYDKNDFIITTNTNIYHIVKPNNDIYTPYYAGSWRLQDMVVDQNDLTWAADLGYMHHNFQYIKPDAPYRNLVSDMHVDADGVLWVTSSNYNTNSAYFNPFGVFKYENGFWSVINKSTRPELDTFFDAIKVLSNPVNNKIYVGSFMSGLLEIDAAEDLTIFDQYSADAPLNGADGDPLRTRIMGLAVDDDGVLWMTNSRTYGSLLVARKLNGEWKSFPSSKFNDYQVEELAVDRNGYKWIKQITGRITVFDSGVLNDDTDDRSIQLGDNNTVLPNNNITTLRADKNGVIWVGTNEGITIFNCAANLFDGACQGNRPIISQDNF